MLKLGAEGTPATRKALAPKGGEPATRNDQLEM
jgi:hypothetical protein